MDKATREIREPTVYEINGQKVSAWKFWFTMLLLTIFLAPGLLISVVVFIVVSAFLFVVLLIQFALIWITDKLSEKLRHD